MYLLALADTVANTKVDFSENDAADVAVKKGKCVVEQRKIIDEILLAPFQCVSVYFTCSASSGARRDGSIYRRYG